MQTSVAGPLILVVDDEETVLETAICVLGELGYRTLMADNAASAIATLELNPDITLVITDIQMPGSMDGLALVSYAASRWPPLRFIVVSGGIVPTAQQMHPGSTFLAKPYRAEMIDSHIRRFWPAAAATAKF